MEIVRPFLQRRVSAVLADARARRAVSPSTCGYSRWRQKLPYFTFSVELVPPADAKQRKSFDRSLALITKKKPEFICLARRQNFLLSPLLRDICAETISLYPLIPLMLTVTCADNLTPAAFHEIVRRFVDMGGNNFLLLRGDACHSSGAQLPSPPPPNVSGLDIATWAHRLAATSEFSQTPLSFAVGGYPCGHPEYVHLPQEEQIAFTLEKCNLAATKPVPVVCSTPPVSPLLDPGSTLTETLAFRDTSTSPSCTLITQMGFSPQDFVAYQRTVKALSARLMPHVHVDYLPSMLAPVSPRLLTNIATLAGLTLQNTQFQHLAKSADQQAEDKVDAHLYHGAMHSVAKVWTEEADITHIHFFCPNEESVRLLHEWL